MKFQTDEVHWDEHCRPVLQPWNAAMPGYTLFVCVGFFINDWFDVAEQPTRVTVYVWARDRDEAVDVSLFNWRLFCDVPNLLNWWAEPASSSSDRKAGQRDARE